MLESQVNNIIYQTVYYRMKWNLKIQNKNITSILVLLMDIIHSERYQLKYHVANKIAKISQTFNLYLVLKRNMLAPKTWQSKVFMSTEYYLSYRCKKDSNEQACRMYFMFLL